MIDIDGVSPERSLAAGRTMWTFHAPGEPSATVLFLHHRDGLDDFTALVVARLLGDGITVGVPDLFDGQPAGLTPRERKQRVRDADAIAVMAAATRRLGAPGLPVAAFGFCMGGRLAFLAGVAGIGVSRTCAVYGGDIDSGWHSAVSPLDRVGPWAAPAQLHRGSRDSNATDAQAQAAVAAYDSAGVYLEATAYAGARHAFANPYATERHHPAATARLWSTVRDFLTTGAESRPVAEASR